MPITFTFDPDPEPPPPLDAPLGRASQDAVVTPVAEITTQAESDYQSGPVMAAFNAAVAPAMAEFREECARVFSGMADPDDTPLTDLVTHTHLRQARVAAGLSQVALAAKAGVTQGYITQIETGRRRPTERVVAAYREAGNIGGNG